MTSFVLGSILILIFVLGTSSASSASEVSQTLNNFAFNAGKIIMRLSSTNFFFSPYSIISAFAMLYAGAKGDTAREIEKVLGASSDIHSSIGHYVRDLNNLGYLSSANRVWLKNGLALCKNYITSLRLNYDSSVQLLDFNGNSEASLTIINDWVSRNTNGKIPNLLQSLDTETRMLLTNAVYFNAEWQKKFNKSYTKPEKFYIDSENYTEVQMMRQCSYLGYAELDGLQIVSIPYKGGRLSMIAVLPPKENYDVLQHLNANTFSLWLEALQTYDVDLWLPRFKTEKKYEFKHVFEALGIKLVFSNIADFSGITADEPLKADEFLHQTFIDVDENRTEAVAITRSRANLLAPPPSLRIPKALFCADRPFFYFIKDNNIDTILFMGYQSFRD